MKHYTAVKGVADPDPGQITEVMDGHNSIMSDLVRIRGCRWSYPIFSLVSNPDHVKVRLDQQS